MNEVDVSHRFAGPNAKLIGKPGGLRELTTPAMVLNLEAFEQNIEAYQHQITSTDCERALTPTATNVQRLRGGR